MTGLRINDASPKIVLLGGIGTPLRRVPSYFSWPAAISNAFASPKRGGQRMIIVHTREDSSVFIYRILVIDEWNDETTQR